ncbi:MAG: hypothetical protein J6W19_12310 [Prevotella sp.]|nr:hypothetical protein [Prevotella sp.]
MKDNNNTNISRIVLAPVDGKLPPKERLESSLEMSDLMTKMATHVICHVIVDYEELLAEERFSVASAFLERVTSTHLCNHKLTKEGIVLRFKGEAFQLHEEYKTMTLTRSVYEHLVMFYFLFTHPKTDEERSVVWNYWKINSKKNLMETTMGHGDRNTDPSLGQVPVPMTHLEIEALRKEIFSTRLGMECYKKLDEWTAPDKPTINGTIAFVRRQNAVDVRRVSYNQAWRYLFGKSQEDMDQLYRHLSIHSHPIYDGLMQYQDQAQKDEGFDGIPLYLSSCFLAYLCRLFLRLIPQGDKMFDEDFTEEEIQVFKALSRVTNIA